MAAAANASMDGGGASMDGAIDGPARNTLDEPVWATIARDLNAVGAKLRTVLIPPGTNIASLRREFCSSRNAEEEDDFATQLQASEASAEVLAALKDWDLWGPLLVCLLLSILLSLSAPSSQGEEVFAAVFSVIWIGATVVTFNAQLLGGSISFFQSVCVLGYCVFPLVVSATFIAISKIFFGELLVVNLILVGIGFLWSTRASVVFIGQFIAAERKFLAVYPVFFFYAFLAWMVSMQ
jgi:hypothetical protein